MPWHAIIVSLLRTGHIDEDIIISLFLSFLSRDIFDIIIKDISRHDVDEPTFSDYSIDDVNITRPKRLFSTFRWLTFRLAAASSDLMFLQPFHFSFRGHWLMSPCYADIITPPVEDISFSRHYYFSMMIISITWWWLSKYDAHCRHCFSLSM